jgi:hypothetical protein
MVTAAMDMATGITTVRNTITGTAMRIMAAITTVTDMAIITTVTHIGMGMDMATAAAGGITGGILGAGIVGC